MIHYDITDVWWKKKGIRKEDQLPVAHDSLEKLQAECFATFGIHCLKPSKHNFKKNKLHKTASQASTNYL